MQSGIREHIDQFDFDSARRLYDERVWDPESDEYLDLCNDVAMLSRMEICGIYVGQRWEPLADKISKRTNDHMITFADAHFVLALGAVGNWEGAEDLINTFSCKGGKIRMEIGVPLCRALIDYRKKNYLSAYETINELRENIYLLGGSHAQRDLFNQIMIDSAIKSKQFNDAKNLLEIRLRMAPKNKLTKKTLAEVKGYIQH